MKPRRAGNDGRNTLRKLCVRATELLEDMHEPVTRGQAADAPLRRYHVIARGLKQTANDLASIAGRIEFTLESGPLPDAARRKVRVRRDVHGPRKS